MTETIILENLKLGTPGITPALGTALLEACVVCFAATKHQSGVELKITGDFDTAFRFEWALSVDEQMRRSWNDEPFTTEQAAYGITALLMPFLHDLTIVERSRRGEGFDFWLGKTRTDTTDLFDVLARVEVSGIRVASSNEIASRVNLKKKQVRQGKVELQTFVVVVEFGKPLANVSRL